MQKADMRPSQECVCGSGQNVTEMLVEAAVDGKVGRGACAEVRLADEVRAEARLAHFLRQ